MARISFGTSWVLPKSAANPGSPVEGTLYHNTTDHNSYIYDGTSWQDMTNPAKVFRTVHTFAVKGNIVATDTIPVFFFSKSSNQTTNIVKARYKIASGTNVTFKVQKGGADWTGYGTTASPLTATTTAATTTQTNALADDDVISLVLVAISGTPVDLTVTLALEHTVS